MTNNRKNILTDKDINTMRNAIFNKNSEGLKYDPYIKIPTSFIEKVIDEDMTPNWKGQVILAYAGSIIAYIEAYHTYRKYHLSIDDIMSLVEVKSNNPKVRKAFSKNSWITEQEYVKNVNELPHSYEVVNNEFIFKTSKEMTKGEINMEFDNMNTRQVRCMEPIRHTKGLKRKRGRGYQILELPILSPDYNDFITLKYSTILDFINEKTTATDIYFLCSLKFKTNNGYLTTIKSYETSYKQLAKDSDLSVNTVMGSINKLTKLYSEAINYTTKTLLIQNQIKSKSILKLLGSRV